MCIVLEVDRVQGMLEYERGKKEEVEGLRQKMEQEIGRLEGENKVLARKIEQVTQKNMEKV